MSDDLNTLRARIDELEAALYWRKDPLRFTFKLSDARTRILALLLSSETVDREIVEQTLGIVTDMKVAIHSLRRELMAWNITIHSKRNIGYWIDGVDKARINAMIAAANDEDLQPPAQAED